MLVLSRKAGESIWIGDDIEIVVCVVQGNRVRLGIRAPASVRVLRSEICQTVPKPQGTGLALEHDSMKAAC